VINLLVACPVCLRRTTAHGDLAVKFDRHRDGLGRVCVMSGRRASLEAVTA